MKPLAMAALVSLGLFTHRAMAQDGQPTPGPAGQHDADSEEQMQALLSQLEALKASYAQEVRRLRELDMQVQALQSRLGGRVAAMPAAQAPAAQAAAAVAAPSPPADAVAAGNVESAGQAPGGVETGFKLTGLDIRHADGAGQKRAQAVARRGVVVDAAQLGVADA